MTDDQSFTLSQAVRCAISKRDAGSQEFVFARGSSQPARPRHAGVLRSHSPEVYNSSSPPISGFNTCQILQTTRSRSEMSTSLPSPTVASRFFDVTWCPAISRTQPVRLPPNRERRKPRAQWLSSDSLELNTPHPSVLAFASHSNDQTESLRPNSVL